MSEIKIFESAEFGRVRTVMDERGEPWFVAKDVADALDIVNVTRALDGLDDDEKGELSQYEGSGRKPLIINEPGLYSLVLRSRKPEAKRFKRWVTHEVLPSIRKTGGYIAAGVQDTPEEIMARALLVAKDTMDRQQQRIAALEQTCSENAPKAIYADCVTASPTSINVRGLAAVLKQRGVDIGEKRLYIWLRENGYCIRQFGSEWNLPTQRSLDLGVMEISQQVVSNSEGGRLCRTTKVTGKGQVYFVNKFLGQQGQKAA